MSLYSCVLHCHERGVEQTEMQYTVKEERARAGEQLTMSEVRWEGQPSVLCELSVAKTGGGVGGNAESLAP
jgi:hypothetical protein